MHRSLGICLTAQETPEKPQIGDSLMKGLCDKSSIQMGSLTYKWRKQDRTARQEGKKKERGKGRGCNMGPSINYVTRISWFFTPLSQVVTFLRPPPPHLVSCHIFCNFTPRNYWIKTAVRKLFLFPFTILRVYWLSPSVGSCHHGMARPLRCGCRSRPPDMEVNCEYIE